MEGIILDQMIHHLLCENAKPDILEPNFKMAWNLITEFNSKTRFLATVFQSEQWS